MCIAEAVDQMIEQNLSRIVQVDEEAPIRANTTILLGNLAKHLSEATCKRVLLNAFTRALKDTFPPARTAGLKVKSSTYRLPFLHMQDSAIAVAKPSEGLVLTSEQWTQVSWISSSSSLRSKVKRGVCRF